LSIAKSVSLGTTSTYNGESKAKQTPYQSSSQNHFKVQVLNTFMKLRKLNAKHMEIEKNNVSHIQKYNIVQAYET